MSAEAPLAPLRAARVAAAAELAARTRLLGLTAVVGAAGPLLHALAVRLAPARGLDPAAAAGAVDRLHAGVGLLLALRAISAATPVRPAAPGAFLAALPVPPRAAHTGRLAASAAVPLVVALATAVGALLAGGAGGALGALGPALLRAAAAFALAALLAPAGRLAPALALGAALLLDRGPAWLSPLAAAGALEGALPWAGAGAWLGVAAAAAARRSRAPLDPPWADLVPSIVGAEEGPGPADASDPVARLNGRGAAALAALLLLLAAAPPPAPRPAERGATRTRRYVATWPAVHADQARALLERADALHDGTCALLGLAPDDAAPPLELDLLPPGEPGPRSDPCREVVLDASAATGLVHVTAHRLVERATGGALRGGWRRASWTFEEGLAQAAASRLVAKDAFWTRFAAAVLHVRRCVVVDEVWDAGLVERTRGVDAPAALGEAWVEALARAGGPSAPGKALAALAEQARGPAPVDGDGARRAWQAIAAAAGAPLDDALVRWLEVIEDSTLGDPRADVPLPRLRLMSEAQESFDLRLAGLVDQDVPPGWDGVCRVRIGDEALPTARLGPDRFGCPAFALRPGASILTGRPRVQLGLRPLDPAARAASIRGGAVWEDWEELDLPN